MDDLIPWLLEQVAIDAGRDRRVTPLAKAMYKAWQPSNPYRFDDQAADVRAEYMHAAAVVVDEQMPGVLAECEAKRRIIQLYQNAVAAQRAGSVSDYNRIQDKAAVDVLGEAVQELAVPYAAMGRPGYREDWRP